MLSKSTWKYCRITEYFGSKCGHCKTNANLYMGISVVITTFEINSKVKKANTKITLVFPNYVFEQNINFPIEKTKASKSSLIKIKVFIVIVWLSCIFLFFIFLSLFFFHCLSVSCDTKHICYFLAALHLFWWSIFFVFNPLNASVALI